jgi:hypothetical protein
MTELPVDFAIDRERLRVLRQSRGQPDLESLVASFLTCSARCMDEIRAAAKGHDARAVVLAAHMLKANAEHVGAEMLRRTAETVAVLANREELPSLRYCVDLLESAMRDTQSAFARLGCQEARS